MRRFALLSFAMLALVSGPARAQFCAGAAGWVFDDVLASDPFCGYITWMAQNGVSLGCQVIDANHRLYCPNSDVSRSQIAALMNRLTTQPDSTSPMVGTITKPVGVFLHNAGNANTFLGVGSGSFSSVAEGNTGVGTVALSSNTAGSFNVAIGTSALTTNTIGSGNTAVGFETMTQNLDGFTNTAVGLRALHNNDRGSLGTAVGAYALFENTSGLGNIAVGVNALTSNTIGSYNTAVGYIAMKNSTLANNNTAIGLGALFDNQGFGNVAVGQAALSSSRNNENVAVGTFALDHLYDGNGNIGVGYFAGDNLAFGSQNIYVGSPGGGSVEDQTIRVGAAQTRTFIAGIRGVTTSSNNAVNVVVDSNGQLGTISSSRDGKDDIADMSDASTALMQLRPVTFHYKADHDPAGPRLQYGLIAEEVAVVYPGMITTKDGKPETVMYQYLAPMLLNEFQKQQRTIEDQAREIRAQRTEIAELKRAVELLMARTASESPLSAR